MTQPIFNEITVTVAETLWEGGGLSSEYPAGFPVAPVPLSCCVSFAWCMALSMKFIKRICV